MTKTKYWTNVAFGFFFVVLCPLLVAFVLYRMNHQEPLGIEDMGSGATTNIVWGETTGIVFEDTSEPEFTVEPEFTIEVTDITADITMTLPGFCPVVVIYDEASEVIWAFSNEGLYMWDFRGEYECMLTWKRG